MDLLSCQLTSNYLLDRPTNGIINTTSDIKGIIINNHDSKNINETLSFKLLRGYQLPAQFYAQYSLEKELGSGGFGYVASVKEKATGQERAIKLIYKNKLPPTSWITTQQGQLLPIEIYILQHVQHRTIIEYVDSFEDDTFFYLVMELHGSPWYRSSSSSSSFSSRLSTPSSLLDTPDLLPSSGPSGSNSSNNNNNDGEVDNVDERHGARQSYDFTGRRGSCDLFECIEHHRTLDESLIRIIFRQIIECVAYLDTMGICHKDLKDENFVIDRNYNVKLIDFGSSVLLPRYYHGNNNSNMTEMLQTQPFYGTLAYASPEILRMEHYQAEPAEIWSLGVLLYTLVFAKMPFTNPRMVLTTHVPLPISSSSSPSTTVSYSCLHLISWLLEKSPSSRPTVHQVLAHPWLRQK
ncbi:kinase-like domain-containing protein [Absidia repens]|uniref:Kinase-like domain-containing protein n=1 Tax=Absidia repens TaxID=90262 RepID=A0A1X2IV04_9FUNG|nr:kinase-like domain-containing protein [Absidia repens]